MHIHNIHVVCCPWALTCIAWLRTAHQLCHYSHCTTLVGVTKASQQLQSVTHPWTHSSSFIQTWSKPTNHMPGSVLHPPPGDTSGFPVSSPSLWVVDQSCDVCLPAVLKRLYRAQVITASVKSFADCFSSPHGRHSRKPITPGNSKSLDPLCYSLLLSPKNRGILGNSFFEWGFFRSKQVEQ